ncbi:MAG TPA: FAD-binding oxidoreductase [Actinospica sp.]|nr:FAD-binding oxidoreductase [Actinospica sp.]
MTELLTAPSVALLTPDSPGYDRARRIWNGMYDRRPAFIARCADAREVAAALRHARELGLPVTVRGGGHNVAGICVADGAALIDLSPMREVRVDAAARIATAEGGCLLGDVDAATVPLGLACPAGVVSHTGLGGLALGGGYGWLARKYGLTCDHVIGAEVVLADGRIVHVSAEQHPDLLWALRGGGGNFGVVTRFTLRLRPVDRTYFHTAVYGLGDAADTLAAYREYAEAQGPDLHAVGAFKRAGEAVWIPRSLQGKPSLFLSVLWLGDPRSGHARTAGRLGGPKPAATASGVMPYAAVQALGDHGEPHGNRYYTKSCYLSELTGGPERVLIDAAGSCPSPRSSIDFEFLGGAIGDPDPEDAPDQVGSAFPQRTAPYQCTASAQWTDPAEDAANAAWSRSTVDALAAWQHGGVYVNYLQNQVPGAAESLYGAERYARLAAVKRAYDPENVFRGHQNIQP